MNNQDLPNTHTHVYTHKHTNTKKAQTCYTPMSRDEHKHTHTHVRALSSVFVAWMKADIGSCLQQGEVGDTLSESFNTTGLTTARAEGGDSFSPHAEQTHARTHAHIDRRACGKDSPDLCGVKRIAEGGGRWQCEVTGERELSLGHLGRPLDRTGSSHAGPHQCRRSLCQGLRSSILSRVQETNTQFAVRVSALVFFSLPECVSYQRFFQCEEACVGP